MLSEWSTNDIKIASDDYGAVFFLFSLEEYIKLWHRSVTDLATQHDAVGRVLIVRALGVQSKGLQKLTGRYLDLGVEDTAIDLSIIENS